jgi:hypothetical protein
MGVFLNDHGLEEEVKKHGSHNQASHGGKGGGRKGGGGGGGSAPSASTDGMTQSIETISGGLQDMTASLEDKMESDFKSGAIDFDKYDRARAGLQSAREAENLLDNARNTTDPSRRYSSLTFASTKLTQFSSKSLRNVYPAIGGNLEIIGDQINGLLSQMDGLG